MGDGLNEFTIFQESNEELGLLFQSYQGLHKIIESFMDVIESKIKILTENPFESKIDMRDDINDFKSKLSPKLIYSPIEIQKVKATANEIKKFKDSVDKSLTRYSKLRNKIAFGGNYLRAIILRPKVYSKEINFDNYEIGNNNIRNINRAMDWCEKALLDLFNLVDQDLNILTIVGRVYIGQKIFESKEDKYTETPEECMEWIENFVYNESFRDAIMVCNDFEERYDRVTSDIFTEAEDESSDKKEDNNEETDDNDIMDIPIEGADDEEDSSKDNGSILNDTIDGNNEEPKSMPKQADKAEGNKNGVRRKKLYVAFIEWAKAYNKKNAFGSIFDKDAFTNTYPFIPEEMRYFYRLANPMMCTLENNLTFFQASELRNINAGNKQKDKYFIFAATLEDLRIFNIEDKKVYIGTDKDGDITIGKCLGESFDLYIQDLVGKGDILNTPLSERTLLDLMIE